jgi:hypothetical protein
MGYRLLRSTILSLPNSCQSVDETSVSNSLRGSPSLVLRRCTSEAAGNSLNNLASCSSSPTKIRPCCRSKLTTGTPIGLFSFSHARLIPRATDRTSPLRIGPPISQSVVFAGWLHSCFRTVSWSRECRSSSVLLRIVRIYRLGWSVVRENSQYCHALSKKFPKAPKADALARNVDFRGSKPFLGLRFWRGGLANFANMICSS